jgi:ubiquinone/menaquinone biosynthesis C-methylase UbiE
VAPFLVVYTLFMSNDPDQLDARYYLDLAAAFIRGKVSATSALPSEDTFRFGIEQGLRLHKFKRTQELPRIRRVLGLLRSLAPADLLDIGSGRGVFLWPLLDAFPDLPVTCIDLREDRVADIQAVARGGISRLRALSGDAGRLEFSNGAFDGVTMLEVLEHTPDPARAVAEIVRVARRFVVMSVPSKPDDNPEHIHLFDPQALTQLFRQAGVQRVSIEYVLNHIVALTMVSS